jgi:hypothetical protein
MKKLSGSCHCGAVEFEVDLENGLKDLRRCNCSLCRRKNAIMACVPIERFRLIKGADVLTLYKWNTMVAEHYFCSICGIYTHHRRRLDPGEYGFNVACLDGIDVNGLGKIPVFDGASLSA